MTAYLGHLVRINSIAINNLPVFITVFMDFLPTENPIEILNSIDYLDSEDPDSCFLTNGITVDTVQKFRRRGQVRTPSGLILNDGERIITFSKNIIAINGYTYDQIIYKAHDTIPGQELNLNFEANTVRGTYSLTDECSGFIGMNLLAGAFDYDIISSDLIPFNDNISVSNAYGITSGYTAYSFHIISGVNAVIEVGYIRNDLL